MTQFIFFDKHILLNIFFSFKINSPIFTNKSYQLQNNMIYNIFIWF